MGLGILFLLLLCVAIVGGPGVRLGRVSGAWRWGGGSVCGGGERGVGGGVAIDRHWRRCIAAR